MHKTIEALCKALDLATKRMREIGNANQSMSRFGWHFAAVSPAELASYPEWLAARLREASPEELSAPLEKALAEFPSRLEALQSNSTINHLSDGNCWQSTAAILATFATLEKLCSPLLEWRQADPKTLPPALAKRLSTVRAGIESVATEASDLAQKVSAINEAHEAAEALPVVLTQLTDARTKTEKAAKIVEAVKANAEKEIGELRKAIEEATALKARAAAVMTECEDTYRSVTAKGLAAAFHQRQEKLERSSWFWIAGLILALGLGAYLGSHRLDALSEVLKVSEPRWGTIWMNVLLSVVGLGAPIWFAWMATKQVGQRFRLAEDYAYKAAIAQAYEGFRREASRHKGDFEQRLLSSALDRLDEAPLRWVEMETHGSPWHELVESPAFQKALEKFPDLRGALAKAKKKRGETKRTSDSAAEAEDAK